MGLLKRPDGSFTVTAEESLQTLLTTHFPECERDEEAGDEEEVCTKLGQSEFITDRKVREAIASF